MLTLGVVLDIATPAAHRHAGESSSRCCRLATVCRPKGTSSPTRLGGGGGAPLVGVPPSPVGDRVEEPVRGVSPTESAMRRTRSRTLSPKRKREEPTNVSEAVPTEKEDGCRGVRETANQPETLVEKGSNEMRGYPQAGILVGTPENHQGQVISR